MKRCLKSWNVQKTNNRGDYMNVSVERVAIELNQLMEARGSKVRFKVQKNDYHSLQTIDIVLDDDVYINSFIIHKTDEFFEEIEAYLDSEFGITGIRYNNTASCFWHEDFVRVDLG